MLVSGVLARRRSLSFDGKWFVILRGYGMLLRILWMMVQLKSECWYELGVWWQNVAFISDVGYISSNLIGE